MRLLTPYEIRAGLPHRHPFYLAWVRRGDALNDARIPFYRNTLSKALLGKCATELTAETIRDVLRGRDCAEGLMADVGYRRHPGANGYYHMGSTAAFERFRVSRSATTSEVAIVEVARDRRTFRVDLSSRRSSRDVFSSDVYSWTRRD